MNLGNTFKNIRKQKGQTQKEFAALCGITQTYLSQIESNKKEPNLSKLKSISEKLKIPLPILFFMALDENDVSPTKRADFNKISPTIKNIINDIFTI